MVAFLESIGYQNNEPLILDSTKFGIPQNRKDFLLLVDWERIN